MCDNPETNRLLRSLYSALDSIWWMLLLIAIACVCTCGMLNDIKEQEKEQTEIQQQMLMEMKK